jgi:hypothetical protein
MGMGSIQTLMEIFHFLDELVQCWCLISATWTALRFTKRRACIGWPIVSASL